MSLFPLNPWVSVNSFNAFSFNALYDEQMAYMEQQHRQLMAQLSNLNRHIRAVQTARNWSVSTMRRLSRSMTNLLHALESTTRHMALLQQLMDPEPALLPAVNGPSNRHGSSNSNNTSNSDSHSHHFRNSSNNVFFNNTNNRNQNNNNNNGGEEKEEEVSDHVDGGEEEDEEEEGEDQNRSNAIRMLMPTILRALLTGPITAVNMDPVEVSPSPDELRRATRQTTYSLIENPYNDQCPITLDAFQPNDTVMQLCHCQHIMSETGYTNWFRSHVRCPVCRHDIRTTS
jgi:hypothetical protein